MTTYHTQDNPPAPSDFELEALDRRRYTERREFGRHDPTGSTWWEVKVNVVEMIRQAVRDVQEGQETRDVSR